MNRIDNGIETFSSSISERYGREVYRTCSLADLGLNVLDMNIVCVLPHYQYTFTHTSY